jgi:hypothetical protein
MAFNPGFEPERLVQGSQYIALPFNQYRVYMAVYTREFLRGEETPRKLYLICTLLQRCAKYRRTRSNYRRSLYQVI